MKKKENISTGELIKFLKMFIWRNMNEDLDFRVKAWEAKDILLKYRIMGVIFSQGIPLIFSLIFLAFGTFSRTSSLIINGTHIFPIEWRDHIVTLIIFLVVFLVFSNYLRKKIDFYFVKLSYKEMRKWQGEKRKVFERIKAHFYDKRQPFEEENYVHII